MKRGRILGIPLMLVLLVIAFFLFRKQIPGLIDKIKNIFKGKNDSSTTVTPDAIVKTDISLPNGNLQNINVG